MSIITPICGFNRNTKKEILYGPLELGGASFRPLWVQQGIGQVTMFIRHWRKDTQADKLSKIAIAWLQAQAGVSFPILAFPSKPLPQLESKWIESMRSFLAKINATIIIDECMSPTLQRLHDFVIMDFIQESGKFFTDAELRRLNYCRLFLRAETVSDLVTVDGSANWSETGPSTVAATTEMQSTRSAPTMQRGRYGDEQTDYGATKRASYFNR